MGSVCVPTMGALHAGHAALIRHAVRVARGRPVVVTVFVNRTQFNEAEDFARYPRMPEADAEVCRVAGAAAVFAPPEEVVYPRGAEIKAPPLPPVATEPGLEDAFRPGHFAGVCQVVKRLFELVRPSAAVFGEKDWQQLKVVEAMTAREGLGVEIIAHPTVREADGLAMSSRNRFLTEEERRRAAGISLALCEAGADEEPRRAEALMRGVLAEHGLAPEYAVVRDATTLTLGVQGSMRALIAARLGAVRLIDNAPWR